MPVHIVAREMLSLVEPKFWDCKYSRTRRLPGVLINFLEENSINDIKEVIVANEFIEKVKDLDEQLRENRTNMDDFRQSVTLVTTMGILTSRSSCWKSSWTY